MKLTMRRPIAYVPRRSGAVALLVIARPVLNPPAVPCEQSSNHSGDRGQAACGAGR
jgi:hypothetical protein